MSLKKSTSRRVIFGAAVLAALFLLLQLVPVQRANPPVEVDLAAPAAVKDLLKRACYDCHSHETKWPWYSRVAPLSWWVARHVAEGRADLNFSQWPVFDRETRGLLLRDIDKQIEDGTMPLNSYVLGHPEARLTEEEIQMIRDWAQEGF